MKRILFYFRLIWRPLVAITVLIGSALLVLTYKISTLFEGATIGERAYYEYVSRGLLLPEYPLYYPTYLLHKVVIHFINPSIVALRITNAFIGLISVIVVFVILRNWFTNRLALMGSGLMLASSWFLVSARSAEPFISSTHLIIIILLAIWLQKTKKFKLALICSGIVIASILYIPGAMWCIIGGIVWKRKFIINISRKVPIWYYALTLLAVLGLLVPMFLRLHNIEFILDLTGLPHQFNGLQVVIVNWINLIFSLFWNANKNKQYPLGTVGLLDVFMSTMLIAGVVTTLKKRYKSRSKLLLSWLLFTSLLVSFAGTVNSIILLPTIILLISIGVGWLLHQWFAVFPKNPLARSIGLVMVSFTVVLSMTYNVYRYFYAWPSMDQAKSSYMQPR